MCIAKLCATIHPCQHRWYDLLRPCSPSSNLSTCDKRLGISGWEVKCEYCPYCYGHSVSEYKLIGIDSLSTATAKKNRAMDSRLNACLFPSSTPPSPSQREDDYKSKKRATLGPASISIKPNFNVWFRMQKGLKGLSRCGIVKLERGA
jgi:hypothetical protein